jgi:myo-inositol-1(or 4)-monophosphatase
MQETALAIQLAKQAGNILLEGLRRPNLVSEQKGVINPVTEIDRQSEAFISQALLAAYPAYGILGEEGASFIQGAAARWIIDPLDGTSNYLRAYPLFAVSIGLEKDGKLVMGVVYNPVLDELFVAEMGGGATCNGKPIHASSVTMLGQAVLASGFPYDSWTAKENNSREWSRFVRRCASMRCDGSAAIDMCHVACGRLEGYWEKWISPWDVAAGAVIAREAGAWVGDLQGGDAILERGETVAANPTLARQMLEVLNQGDDQ